MLRQEGGHSKMHDSPRGRPQQSARLTLRAATWGWMMERLATPTNWTVKLLMTWRALTTFPDCGGVVTVSV